jgi:hypothetical protein
MHTYGMNMREISKDPYQLELGMESSMFGQEYVNAYLAWYQQIGVPLTMRPYKKDQQGQFVNQDGSVILRDASRERQVIRQYLCSQP